MPLYSEPFALDSESDVYEDGEKKTRLIQICPVSAHGLEDVRVYYGWDAWDSSLTLSTRPTARSN